jgi:hypothetical protein
VRKSSQEPLTGGQRILAGTLGFAFFAVGATFLLFILKDCVYGAWRTRDQTTAQATLRSVEVRQAGRTRSLDVLYDYQVSGQHYTGTRIALFQESMPFQQRLSDAWRRGTPVQVFIDPQYPEFAVIDRGFSLWPMAVAIPFSLAFATVGAWLLVAAFRAPSPFLK